MHTNLEKKIPQKILQHLTKNELRVYINRGFCNRATTVFKRV